MENLQNNMILAKLDEIIVDIQNSNNYQEYQFLYHKLLKNEKVCHLIQKIKVLQKKIVRMEVNKEDTSTLEQEIQNLLLELDRVPLYQEYILKQKELNNEFQEIKNCLDQYFYELLN